MGLYVSLKLTLKLKRSLSIDLYISIHFDEILSKWYFWVMSYFDDLHGFVDNFFLLMYKL